MQGLKQRGILVCSGPLEPRFGGAALLRVPDDQAPDILDTIRDNDPYVKNKVAQWEVMVWKVATGKEELDGI